MAKNWPGTIENYYRQVSEESGSRKRLQGPEKDFDILTQGSSNSVRHAQLMFFIVRILKGEMTDCLVPICCANPVF